MTNMAGNALSIGVQSFPVAGSCEMGQWHDVQLRPDEIHQAPSETS